MRLPQIVIDVTREDGQTQRLVIRDAILEDVSDAVGDAPSAPDIAPAPETPAPETPAPAPDAVPETPEAILPPPPPAHVPGGSGMVSR